ncbi:MAG: HIT family protein [Desulfuromonadaceae bacterium]|jgi:diadenosine tetraphosphate (Ap4A) HIT family hydrolase
MPSATLKKFGYPSAVLEEGSRWVVLLRPDQVTLGSLVLVCKEPVQAFSEISSEAFADLQEIIGRIEGALARVFTYDKINYLMLMMVDPDVHFHIIPRYAQERCFAEISFYDAAWPGPPDLARVNKIDDAVREALRDHLIAHWN